ncbi:GyrI-like domain-containing protein [Neobacillus dielmonensis]|uniref:GyrI-like domain-containing protein n=1 Tax=Neobacillus dielmonensis TaxID=1347369 RepID=UPI0005AB0C0F|nr:GyrI-like domain-containing protein [Neobacillus dielmonensis]
MDIKVVEKDSMKVVGISWNGCYSQTESIPSLFKVLEEREEEIPYKSEEPILVAPFHSRETEFTYYVTTPVEKLDEIPEGMVGFTIPKKNYVYTKHVGKPEDVQSTYLQLFTWMNEYGYDQDHQALSLEIYQKKTSHPEDQGNLYLEIYLPVKTYK